MNFIQNIYKIDIHHMFWNQIEIETILSQFVSNNKVVSFHPCCKLSQIFIYIFIYKCILFYHLIWRRGWAHGNKIYHIKFLFISDYQYFRWFLSKSIFFISIVILYTVKPVWSSQPWNSLSLHPLFEMNILSLPCKNNSL